MTSSLAAVFIALVCVTSSRGEVTCPEECRCGVVSGAPSADCSGRQITDLVSVLRQLHPDTQVTCKRSMLNSSSVHHHILQLFTIKYRLSNIDSLGHRLLWRSNRVCKAFIARTRAYCCGGPDEPCVGKRGPFGILEHPAPRSNLATPQGTVYSSVAVPPLGL